MRRIFEMKGAGSPTQYERLAKRAIATRFEGVAYVLYLNLKTLDPVRLDPAYRKRVDAICRKLRKIVIPATSAALELQNRFGARLAETAEGQPRTFRNLPANEILRATELRLAASRIRELESLRLSALERGEYVEATIASLFLLSEYSRSGRVRSARRILGEIRRLEEEHGARSFDGGRFATPL